MASSANAAARKRIDKWIDKLEDQAEEMMALVEQALGLPVAVESGDSKSESGVPAIAPFQAVQSAGRYLSLVAKFMELRQLFDDEEDLQGEWEAIARELLSKLTPAEQKKYLRSHNIPPDERSS